jgi:hypothetical protein
MSWVPLSLVVPVARLGRIDGSNLGSINFGRRTEARKKTASSK